ncbi:hypothetical protein NSK_004553 [Nannochloropsis salina CCMP1776]|uniref:Uncharacterized protein n=1 Tax=Nannochloropsis salina CCMP1776 TaxID=1027361 RepID=A0A4D9CXT1_9STRA|nr:hypothetical protein NSK_004553 [Nannochloropsis salina CCMP1776]|eukprot:TFJ84080.1 hypothetical protein NSK_004553 [Nannochloropsis salina CCMP1776]
MDPPRSSDSHSLKSPLLLDHRAPKAISPSAPPAPSVSEDSPQRLYPPMPEPDSPFLSPSSRFLAADTTSDEARWAGAPAPSWRTETAGSPAHRLQNVPSAPSASAGNTRSHHPAISSLRPSSEFLGQAQALAMRRVTEENLRAEEASRQGWQRNVLDHATLRAAEAAAAARRSRPGLEESEGLQVDPSMHDGAPCLTELLEAGKKREGGSEGGRDGGKEGGHHDGYKMAEYDIKEGYQISEYRSIYDS